jgi:hypothetical protein
VALLARADSKRSADASDRAAAAAEGELALARQEAEERRQDALPKPELSLRHVSGQAWVLENNGTATAEGVTVDLAGTGSAIIDAPAGVTLAPGAGHKLFIAPGMADPDPTHLLVTWTGQNDPVSLPVRK